MSNATQHFDAVVIGAGFSGIHMLKSLRDKLGLKVRVYEAGETVGGTWYWNRYPGARCDSDSYIYCFTFDKQLLQDWEWSERYPEQPEILRYLEHVAARHDLKRDIVFDTRVIGARFDDATQLWTVETDKGDYDGVVKRIRESFFGQEHYFIPKSALEATPEEREREFDRMWDAGGFAFWLANYQDMFFNAEANRLCADYIERKIRKTVKDPVVAEKLIR